MLFSLGSSYSQSNYREDFLFLWKEIGENYAYFDKAKINWTEVREFYLPRVDSVQTKGEFVTLLERFLNELKDNHTHLLINTPQSPRLLPSGTDMWVSYSKGKVTVDQVREGSVIKPLLLPHDEIIALNKKSISKHIQNNMVQFAKQDASAFEKVANTICAGDYKIPRKITIRRGQDTLQVDLGISEYPRARKNLLTLKKINDSLGYIKIHNALGNLDLIQAFNTALDKVKHSKALIIDLRDTPSGGDSQVAIPILGRFTKRAQPYQIHERVADNRRWEEIVYPQGAYYDKPIYVLVNRWTGSMGEGFAIGLHAFGNTKIIGTKMARLKGATYTVQLPSTKIKANITHERLYHINGTPREEILPDVYILHDPSFKGDLILNKALKVILQ